MHKKPRMAFNVGTSSILVVFVLLCLATFAVLSLVSANGDYKLSTQLRDRTTAYYQACSQAELRLADIDSTLEQCFEESASEADYFLLASSRLDIESDRTMSWTENISDNQQLKIELAVTYPSDIHPCYYDIHCWIVEQTDYTETDNTLNLLDMEAGNP